MRKAKKGRDEAKRREIRKYNRPKGERAQKQRSEENKIKREVMLDENSRPKEQKKMQNDDTAALL